MFNSTNNLRKNQSPDLGIQSDKLQQQKSDENHQLGDVYHFIKKATQLGKAEMLVSE